MTEDKKPKPEAKRIKQPVDQETSPPAPPVSAEKHDKKPEESKLEKMAEAAAPKEEKKPEAQSKKAEALIKPKAEAQSKESSTASEPKTQSSTNDKGGAEEKTKTPTKKKTDTKPKVKKYEAVAYGRSMPISTKQASYICSFVKDKEIDNAIADLNSVLLFKKAIPFKGEIPHRKGPGMMSGRYPIKASKLFINLLKALKGNALVNNLEIDNTKIAIASASQAARPMRTGGRQAKRTHVTLKAREIKEKKKK